MMSWIYMRIWKMNKEKKKDMMVFTLILLGFTIIVFTLFLYFGENFMESCCLKICCIIILVVAFVSGIIGICVCSSNEKQSCEKFLVEEKTGFVLIHKNQGNKSYTVYQFDTLDSALKQASENDIIKIYDSEIKFSENAFKDITHEKIKNVSIIIPR